MGQFFSFHFVYYFDGLIKMSHEISVIFNIEWAVSVLKLVGRRSAKQTLRFIELPLKGGEHLQERAGHVMCNSCASDWGCGDPRPLGMVRIGSCTLVSSQSQVSRWGWTSWDRQGGSLEPHWARLNMWLASRRASFSFIYFARNWASETALWKKRFSAVFSPWMCMSTFSSVRNISAFWQCLQTTEVMIWKRPGQAIAALGVP